MKVSVLQFIGMLCLLSGSVYSQTAPPNIIFLLTDDQRWNALRAVGNSVIETPQIDSLSKQGVTFDNAYVTTSICSASRASMLIGQHYSRDSLNQFFSIFSAAQLAQTYPVVLRKAGYYTGFIGKWGLGDPLPTTSFDRWYGFSGQGNYEIKVGGVVVGHITPKMGDQALEFLDSSKGKGKPFCLSVSFKAPHIEDGDPRQFIPDPADMGLYLNATIPTSPNSDPAFFNALPAFLKDPSTEMRSRWTLEFNTPTKYQESMKNYYRLISGVDHVVGRIRSKLQAMGVAGNTVIVFSSDNGFFTGDRGYSGKWLSHDPSIRVPLIVYDPRLSPSKKGIHRKEMALNIDIPATILSLAGVPAPVTMQGRDLMGLINGTAKMWRSEYLHDFTLLLPGIPLSYAAVGQRYKYILYPFVTPQYEELYDLQTDPNESFNLIGNAKYTTILDSMKTRFVALKASSAVDNVVKELQVPVENPIAIRSAKHNGAKSSYRVRRLIDSRGVTLPLHPEGERAPVGVHFKPEP